MDFLYFWVSLGVVVLTGLWVAVDARINRVPTYGDRYDMNTGAIAWQTPTGVGQDRIRNHPARKGIELGPIGGLGGPGGPLITKTLLIYGLIPPVGGSETGAKLVAYDKQSGAILGEVALPASPLGTPMTYLANGKQYIALTLLGGQMVALALP